MNRKKIVATFLCLCTLAVFGQQQNEANSLNDEANKYLFGIGVEKMNKRHLHFFYNLQKAVMHLL